MTIVLSVSQCQNLRQGAAILDFMFYMTLLVFTNVIHKCVFKLLVFINFPINIYAVISNTGATISDRGQHNTGKRGGGMLRHSPNHGTLRLPNGTEDDVNNLAHKNNNVIVSDATCVYPHNYRFLSITNIGILICIMFCCSALSNPPLLGSVYCLFFKKYLLSDSIVDVVNNFTIPLHVDCLDYHNNSKATHE